MNMSQHQDMKPSVCPRERAFEIIHGFLSWRRRLLGALRLFSLLWERLADCSSCPSVKSPPENRVQDMEWLAIVPQDPFRSSSANVKRGR